MFRGDKQTHSQNDRYPELACIFYAAISVLIYLLLSLIYLLDVFVMSPTQLDAKHLYKYVFNLRVLLCRRQA